jgi:hypothetical protein
MLVGINPKSLVNVSVPSILRLQMQPNLSCIPGRNNHAKVRLHPIIQTSP